MASTCLAQISGSLARKFDDVRKLAGHEGTSIPAKRQPRR